MIRLITIHLLALLSLGGAASPAPPQDAPTMLVATTAPAPQQASDFTDEQVLAVWETLDEATRVEVIEWFHVELERLNTFQMTLLRFVLTEDVQDPNDWPEYQEPAPYDPETHAPAQPIKRKTLAPGSAKLKQKRKDFANGAPERKLISAWLYDYGTQDLQRLPNLHDNDRIFRNAVNGFPPGLDLVEALVEKKLDDGKWQDQAIAFGHPYTDRNGGVYTGLTLYDAWASGTKMEMPDVDSLGILHDLDNDWKSFKAPVSEGKQKKLYAKIAKHFEPLHNHRGLRHALSRTFLIGYPKMRDGYYPNLDRFHSLWEQNKSTPKQLEKDLPTAKRWEGFLKGLVRKYDKSKKLREAAEKRRDTLHNDGLWVRQTMVNILLRSGFLK